MTNTDNPEENNSKKNSVEANQEKNLQIRVPDQISGGLFANFTIINHNADDFMLDFAFIEPGSQRATVRSRVLLTPTHFKRLVRAMQANLLRYEQLFGEIKEPKMHFPTPTGPVN